ncbi:unnamed protein product [Colias eurytheme]|nr:unnamed protein product [Colias eurytheme]
MAESTECNVDLPSNENYELNNMFAIEDLHQSNDERNVVLLQPTKRGRESDNEQEEEWTQVSRKIKKKALEDIQISVTCKEKFPKQYALANIFKDNCINGILRIKYTNPYKIIITFSTETCAEKFLSCEAFVEMGWSSSKVWEVGFSYGVVKDIDADLPDEDLLKSIDSPVKIANIRRLNRRSGDEWIPSECVRIGFEGPTLPPFIYIYELRVKVDTYIFPVTQCTHCWRFGHTKKFCPSNRIICPKCADHHENCDSTIFKCSNCRGSHTAFSRICPTYAREKRVRELMSEFNVTYRKALTMYVPPTPIHRVDYKKIDDMHKDKLDNSVTINLKNDEDVASSANKSNKSYAEALQTPKHNINNKKGKSSYKNIDIMDVQEVEEEKEVFDWNQFESDSLNECSVNNSKNHKDGEALCESWLQPGSLCKVTNYNMFRQDRDSSYGGVAILTHKSIDAYQVPISDVPLGLEIIHVKIKNCSIVENIYSLYCPSNVTISQNDWELLFARMNYKSIVMGDFNAHHSAWSNKTDIRGVRLFDSLIDNNLGILNDGRATRFQLVENVLRESSPDVTLVSNDIYLNFSWNVTNECMGSDHLIIKIKAVISYVPKNIKRRNFKLANWPGYTNFLRNEFLNFDFNIDYDVQQLYNLFIKTVNVAADKFIPFTKICFKPQSKFVPKPYWSPELSKAVASRRLALSKFRRNPTPSNLDVLNNEIRISQQLIRNAQNEHWKKFCSSFDDVCSARDMWNRMKWYKGIPAKITHVDSQKAENLLNVLCPYFVSPDKPDFSSFNEKIEAEISLHEFEKSIKVKDTAPGHDEVSYSMIKYLPKRGKEI